ncbi:MAG: DUF1285 domain-containing protein [Kofleriaceae bacterium]|nr:DUF1285 domain-containing protein [Kofleriaceae bacterium]
MTSSPLPAALIEKLRETGIRLDRAGRFWHEDGEITHQRFRKTLLRWLDTREDGRIVLRLDGERYAYIDIDDAALLVTSMVWRDGVPMITLNDDSEEYLDCDTLEQAPDNSIYCRVREGKLLARFLTQPYYKLADFIEEIEDGFALRVGNKLYPIKSR